MKLYRFSYSPFARKVQAVLDLLGRPYEIVEVPYGDRAEIVRVSGGVMVPVLVDDDGRAIRESRAICEHLLVGEARARLVPSPWEGPIWAYHDFCDGPFEDVAFRIASPFIRLHKTPEDRAMFVFIKERKFGAGCVDAWERDRDALIERARSLIAPTLETFASRPFVFGDRPTLADAALYGQAMMLHEADPALLRRVSEGLASFAQRFEAQLKRAR